MAAMGGFYSTPAFEIFRRGLITQTVKKFRGINAYLPLSSLSPEFAQDCLNVVVGSNGLLSKLRLPLTLTPDIGVTAGPQSFWELQQGSGTRSVLAQFGSSMYSLTNDLATATLVETNSNNAGMWSMVEANSILFGANGTRAQKWTGSAWQAWGIAAPTVAPTAPTISAGGLSPTTGYQYKYAYKNSVTGHVSSVSPASATTGAQTNQRFTTTAAASTDAQVDTLMWFRTLDGGGDYFKVAEVTIATGAVLFNSGTVTSTGLNIVDNTSDSSLDLTTRGPLINSPPPVGTMLARGQGRVFVAGITGAPQDIAYSGYEQILTGRPEESFPTNNRLRLSIGAESIAGMGVLQAGLVAFSNTGHMYMLRGSVEDITLSVPVGFSAFLEELPWTLGCLSHFTIQSTPYGLIWLAGDKTVQLFNGRAEPTDISPGVYPILRRITPGQESKCRSGYFNWLERDWYVLAVPIDGATTPNRLFFFALDPQEREIDVFVSDIGAEFLGVISTSKLQRVLLLAQSGFVKQLPVSADTVGGIADLSIIPAVPASSMGVATVGASITDTSGGSSSQAWTNPTNAFAQDGLNAVASLGAVATVSSQRSDFLTLTGWGFNVPAGATVLGIKVEVFRSMNVVAGGAVSDNHVQILKAGITVGADKANTVTVWPTVAAFATYGSPTDLWGVTWSSSQINDPNFGVRIAASGTVTPVSGTPVQAQIDFVRITVYLQGTLNAFWRGGYFGNESPQRSKLFRRARLVSDQSTSAFKVLARFVDDLDRTLAAPEIVGPIIPTASRIPLNRRAHRVSIEIQFPPQDVSSNVLEYSVAGIQTSDR